MKQINKSEQDAIVLHVAFSIVASVTIITSPRDDLGLRIWSLIIGWYTSIIFTAHQRNHTHWLHIVKFLLLICICFIFPDGFLVKGLKTLWFPDMGVGQIFGVTSFMPFMWAIPLFISTLVGIGMEDRGAGIDQAAISAGIMGLILMGGSEGVLTRIPVWHVLDNNCSTMGHYIAIYVLFPEFCLGMCTYLGWKYIRLEHGRVSFLRWFSVAFLIMCVYLGNLIVCFMIIDGDKL